MYAIVWSSPKKPNTKGRRRKRNERKKVRESEQKYHTCACVRISCVRSLQVRSGAIIITIWVTQSRWATNMPIKIGHKHSFSIHIDTSRCDSWIFWYGKVFFFLRWFAFRLSKIVFLLIPLLFGSFGVIGFFLFILRCTFCMRAGTLFRTHQFRFPCYTAFPNFCFDFITFDAESCTNQTNHQAIFISKCKLIQLKRIASWLVLASQFRIFHA